MHTSAYTHAAAIFLATALGSACAPPGPAEKAVVAVRVRPENPSVVVGEVLPLTASLVHLDGAIDNVSGKATWSVDDATIATITSDGIVTGVLAGSTRVRATYSTLTSPDELITVQGDGSETPAPTPTPGEGSGAVVISEVMANPSDAGDATGEYIELVNVGTDPVDLQDWTIDDGDSSDTLIAFTSLGATDMILEAGDYALILDAGYNTTVLDYHIPSGVLLLTVDGAALGNGLTGDDPITIKDSAGTVVTTYGTPFDQADAFPTDPGNGRSMERECLTDADASSNWSAPTDPDNHTAGEVNSVNVSC